MLLEQEQKDTRLDPKISQYITKLQAALRAAGMSDSQLSSAIADIKSKGADPEALKAALSNNADQGALSGVTQKLFTGELDSKVITNISSILRQMSAFTTSAKKEREEEAEEASKTSSETGTKTGTTSGTKTGTIGTKGTKSTSRL